MRRHPLRRHRRTTLLAVHAGRGRRRRIAAELIAVRVEPVHPVLVAEAVMAMMLAVSISDRIADRSGTDQRCHRDGRNHPLVLEEL